MAQAVQEKGGKGLPHLKVKFVNHKEYLRRTSFYELLDFKATMNGIAKEVKDHNQRLKDLKIKRGRLRGIENTVKILLKILIKEMEWYRKNNFQQYLLFMHKDTPTLPLFTNRGQISTMDNETPCLRTVSTRIQKLMNVIDFITHKRNTSRVCRTMRDEDGKEYRVYKSLAGEKDKDGNDKTGRGDFRLQINKKWLCMASMVIKKAKNDAPILRISENPNIAENQPVRTPQSKILQQPNVILISESPINHKKSCSNSIDGVATPHELRSTIVDDDFYDGDEKGMQIFSDDGKQISGKFLEEMPHFLKKVISEVDGRPRIVPLQKPKGQIYLDQFKKEKLLRQNLPKKQEDYYAQLLWWLLVSRLYPNYHNERITSYTKFGIKMMKNQMVRLDAMEYGLDAAYWIIARAIDKAHDYKVAHPKFKFMSPLAYLRLDYKGSLRVVIDEWVIEKEIKLLKLEKESNYQLVEYQDAILLTEKLFLNVSKAYLLGYFEGKKAVRSASDKLEKLFSIQKNLSEKSKAKIRKDFADKVVSLVVNFEKQASEYGVMDGDVTWENFKNHLTSFD